MKKFIVILFIAILALSVAHADEPAGAGYEIMGHGGQNGLSPRTLAIPVRYAREDANSPSLSSGDVVIWDVTSADGLTISACEADSDGTYAGVMISTIQTADIASTTRRGTRNWGKMAIKGYCLAKCDTSESTAGMPINPNGATLFASFETLKGDPPTGETMSADLGVLLADTGTDGLMPVILR